MNIDFTVIPHQFSLFKLSGHDLSQSASPSSTRTSEARTESIIEKAQNSKGSLSLIESKIILGEGATIVLTLAAQSLWEQGSDMWYGREDESGREPRMTAVDEVDMMIARNVLKGYVEKASGLFPRLFLLRWHLPY